MPKYLVSATIPVHAECEIEAENILEARRVADSLVYDHFTWWVPDSHSEVFVDGIYEGGKTSKPFEKYVEA